MVQGKDLLVLDFQSHLKFNHAILDVVPVALHIVNHLVPCLLDIFLEPLVFLLEQAAFLASFFSVLVRLEEFLLHLGQLLHGYREFVFCLLRLEQFLVEASVYLL